MNKNPEFIEELLKLLSAADQSKLSLCILRAQQQNQENNNLIFDLGVQLARCNRFNDALIIFTRLFEHVKDNIRLPYNIGLIYSLQGRHQDALDAYFQALQINSNDVETLINIGAVYIDLKNFSSALEMLNKAISLNPKIADSYSNKGIALSNLGRDEESLSSYTQAIEINPNHIVALSNLGALYFKLNRYSEALVIQNKIIALKPHEAKNWLGLGEILSKLNMHHDAIRNFDEATKLNPNYAEAYLNKGISLSQIRRFSEASIEYDEALKIKGDYAEALFNKGIALYELGEIEASILFTGKAIKENPKLIEAWESRAFLLLKLGLYQDSIKHLEYALNLDNKFNYIEGNLLHTRMVICDWSNYNQNLINIIKKVKLGEKVISPFALSALVDDGSLIKYCAELASGQSNQPNLSARLPRHPKKNRITIGYYSANFYNHAIGYLISEIFHLHDKEKFDLVGFSFGSAIYDETQQKIANEFDRFHILENKSDEEIVALSHKEKIDIAIDLIGFTENKRTSVFDSRVAPIQVNYLGYPGTMGSNNYDYIIADKIIVPKQFREDYVEKIAYMPGSYQANDRWKKISSKEFLKNDLGLPQRAFVFACFNNNYKITPTTFDVWMRILSKVNNSVLWLLADNIIAKKNLLDEAASRGIERSRLIFAERCNLSDHLARHKQADLFLDTFPYNAHTTASDALWAGMPIITLIGNSFASRVAASLLNAVNMPELITNSQEEYEALAIDLATNPEKLYAIKQKLAKNLISEPLFDTPLFTRNIEALYVKMHQRYIDGLSPDHLSLN